MAIALDSAGGGEGSAAPTLTFSFNNAAGDIAFVGCESFADSNDEVTGITYGGVAMTRINTRAGSGSRSYLYYLLAPPTGSNNVVITVGSNRYVQAFAASFSGAQQSGVPDASNTKFQSSGTTMSQSLTTVADNCFTVGFFKNHGGSFSAGAGTTLAGSASGDGSYRIAYAGPKTPAGSVTLTLTYSPSIEASMCMASFAPSTGVIENVSLDPASLELTVPDVTASAGVVEDVSLSPVSLELSVVDPSVEITNTVNMTSAVLALRALDMTTSVIAPAIEDEETTSSLRYMVDLLGVTGGEAIDSLYTPDITVRGWSDRINAPGKLVFSMHRNHPDATDENLRMWRHVRFFRTPRDGSATKVAIWYGIILSKRMVGDRMEVLCHGALRIFDKRDVTGTFTGEGSADAFDLLSVTNTNVGPTGISEGAGGVTTTMNQTLSGVTFSRAMEEFAGATGAEYRVNVDAQLDFVPSLGSNKSETIELIFHMDGRPGTNLREFELAEDGEPMANVIIGTSSGGGGLTHTYSHPTSSDTYPVLQERKAFNNANDSGTLEALTEAYGLQRAFPIPDFQAVPATATKKLNPYTGQREIAGLQYEDVAVGDLVLVTIVTPNRDESVVKRIAELIVDVDENGNESLRFTLTEAGVFVTERYLDESAFQDIKLRIQQIESQL